ncbi:nitroreductase family protein [Fodinibius salsisoli]|uniref:Nitroreductase family protein n=1 Tax=Fodinibius salsisoli TaxID=2820877 RepID=A0ABT3PLL8_9BACT|nr:nitroreductase family protein [Fodinibius salsisoli]MCW9706845.1 nitroreductase family protein [Fodinibius salsisoli]
MPKEDLDMISKEAETNYPIHNLLRKRWSPRSFSDQSIDEELLHQLFEAARWAPSSYNEQPWRFIVARKEEEEAFSKLSKVINDFNRTWATDAPVLVLGLAKQSFDANGRPNRHANHDLGQAIAHLTFEATRHDLFVHQMAGILPDKARELYDISEAYKPLTMFTIGYEGEVDSLPIKLAEKETTLRSRKPLDDIVFKGQWGEK